MKKLILVLFTFLAFSATAADSTSSDSNQQSQPSSPPPMSADMKAAFDACKAQGKPGDTAFDSCMSSKGFKKPEGGPGHGCNKESAEMKAAFDACKANGKPGDSAFDSCMDSKGFKKPEHQPDQQEQEGSQQ